MKRPDFIRFAGGTLAVGLLAARSQIIAKRPLVEARECRLPVDEMT
jgi:hypothetical protein